jgi:hypothetical protein
MACAQVAGQRLRGGLGLGVESAEQRQKTKYVDVGCCRRVEQAIQGVFGLGAERRGEERKKLEKKRKAIEPLQEMATGA